VATFLIVAVATGSNLLHGAAIGVVLVGALWMVLGYALHCTAFAAAGSLITRESDRPTSPSRSRCRSCSPMRCRSGSSSAARATASLSLREALRAES
jgi:hypothetical protein